MHSQICIRTLHSDQSSLGCSSLGNATLAVGCSMRYIGKRLHACRPEKLVSDARHMSLDLCTYAQTTSQLASYRAGRDAGPDGQRISMVPMVDPQHWLHALEAHLTGSRMRDHDWGLGSGLIVHWVSKKSISQSWCDKCVSRAKLLCYPAG
ncbi:hypothetical protein IQ06DRAFT_52193 [Phaeosphaeriaceae sp. SRC1lsM3a]|nr:hypothetical protein IQ06DRAFT_52193 [Stagonospora sp. SRC1lsM3a]